MPLARRMLSSVGRRVAGWLEWVIAPVGTSFPLTFDPPPDSIRMTGGGHE